LLRTLRNVETSTEPLRQLKHFRARATAEDVPQPIDLFSDPDVFVREAAAWLLSDLGRVEALPQLLNALQTGKDEGTNSDGLIVITLEGGCEFAFPVALAEGLADAPRSKLRKIKISPNGLGLHWPLLDADLYVPGLIEGAFGHVGGCNRLANSGVKRSSIKAEASREKVNAAAVPK